MICGCCNNKINFKRYTYRRYKYTICADCAAFIKFYDDTVPDYIDTFIEKVKVEKIKERVAHPLKDLNRRLKEYLRRGIRKKRWKNKHIIDAIALFGTDRESFIKYIESLWEPGMSWANYGNWHLDHKIPLSRIEYKEDLEMICHFSNLRPVWGIDNILKSTHSI